MIQLSWGAVLYSYENYVQHPVPDSPDDEARGSGSNSNNRSSGAGSKRVGTLQPWKVRSVSIMSSMVLLLDLVKVTADLVHFKYSDWFAAGPVQDRGGILTLMEALEAVYYHAHCFNSEANAALRVQLRQAGFMRFREAPLRPVHLLDQEVQAATMLLALAFRMYDTAPNDVAPELIIQR